jgi:ankyrin repeat protein
MAPFEIALPRVILVCRNFLQVQFALWSMRITGRNEVRMDAIDSLYQAVMHGDLSRVVEILDRTPHLCNARTPSGVPLVLFALYYNQPQVAQAFLERAAEVDIFTAAAAGLTNRLREWIKDQPGLVNAVASDGFSPLGLASFFGQAEAVDVLLDHQADVNAPSNNPQTVMPLHSAAAGQHLGIARRLIERGADVNARQAGDFTPLHAAAQNGQIELVELLLVNGAEVNPRTVEGRTPIDYAREGGHDRVVELLMTHGAAG